jgi:hypothetical protein
MPERRSADAGARTIGPRRCRLCGSASGYSHSKNALTVVRGPPSPPGGAAADQQRSGEHAQAAERLGAVHEPDHADDPPRQGRRGAARRAARLRGRAAAVMARGRVRRLRAAGRGATVVLRRAHAGKGRGADRPCHRSQRAPQRCRRASGRSRRAGSGRARSLCAANVSSSRGVPATMTFRRARTRWPALGYRG